MSEASSGLRTLLGLAAFVVVVAGMKAAGPLIVTLLLSGFIAILCAPSFILMQHYKVPSWLAIVVLMGFLVLLQIGFITVATSTISEFSKDLPVYQEKIQALFYGVIEKLNGLGLPVSLDVIKERFDPAMGFELATSTLSGIGSIASNAFVILLAVLFILLEGSSFSHKLKHAFGGESAVESAGRFIDTLKVYMGIKTAVSITTGILVYLLLSVVGVDYPFVWALVAFLFNFVPSIGSVIAAIPAILLAVVQLGVPEAAIVAGGYAVINVVLGNIVEPRLMGKGMGLSPFVVFLSLVFWGWVLGPVGMLLSVPLTVFFKIAMDGSDDTRWISVLLGPDMTDEDFESMNADVSEGADHESV